MQLNSAFAKWRPHAQIPTTSSVTATSPRVKPLPSLTTGLLHLYQKCNQDFRFLQSVPRRCLTKPSQPVYNNDYDNRLHDYILHVNDTLSDDHGNRFAVLDLLGTGTFGQVVKCRHENTGEIVAVKVIKNQPAYFNQAWVEINILRMLHRNNSPEDTKYIVRFFSHFIFRGHLCLVFEKLSINLYELLKQNSYAGVSLEMLRNFLTQILQALNVLVESEVIHCDLKPENILLKTLDTAQLKIIDFGSACQLHYPVYSYVQSRFYRSPEVLLGAQEYDSKIDMWSLGCVAGELFLGIPLFPGQNEMNMICRIVEMLDGMPDRFLRRCRHTKRFFNCPRAGEQGADEMQVYQLKPLAQYEQETSTTLPEWKRFFTERKLRDIIMTYPYRTPAPHEEEKALRESLIDLLGGMLKVDPRDRWTPAEALQHPFIKGEPLLHGQAWLPPSRPRVVRSRRVPIPIPDVDEPTPLEGFYSASAPNFNAKGHLNMNTTWGTGAGGQPIGIGTGVPPFQVPHHFNPLNPQANTTAYADMDSPGLGQSFAPGSYVPSSTLTMFAPSMGQTGPRRRSAAASNSGMTNAGSHDPRAFLYSVGGASSDALQRSMGNMTDSPNAVVPRGSTSPMPFAAVRLGGSLHVSGSRESLTGSLRMSGSRDSLAMGRTPSVGDLTEDPMFAFGSDDEAFMPSQGALGSVSMSQHQSQHMQSTNMGMGGASAALPPAGPRLLQGRSAPAAYGQPSTLSSYSYTSANQQQTRPFDTTTGPAQSAGADAAMSDIQQDDGGAMNHDSVTEDPFHGSYRQNAESRSFKHIYGTSREHFSSRRTLRKGS